MKIYDELLTEFKKGQTGYSTIAIIGQSCIGSIAAMLVLKNEIPVFIKLSALFLVTVFCMAYNGAVLVHLNARTTLNLLITSVVFSLLTIAALLVI